METKNFHFEDGANVRILPLMENETSWFVATDVCNLLGLDNSSRALERLDEDEKQKIDIECEGQVRKMWIINEFGKCIEIYHFFKDWLNLYVGEINLFRFSFYIFFRCFRSCIIYIIFLIYMAFSGGQQEE